MKKRPLYVPGLFIFLMGVYCLWGTGSWLIGVVLLTIGSGLMMHTKNDPSDDSKDLDIKFPFE